MSIEHLPVPLIATGADGGGLIVHRDGEPPQVLEGLNGTVCSLSFCPTNPDLLVSASPLKGLTLWDLKNSSNIKTLQCPSHLSSASWSCDGHYIVAACNDCKCYVYNAHNGFAMFCVLRGHTNAISAVAFHPHNPAVCATASQDNTVRVWRLVVDPEQRCLKVLVHGVPVQSCCWMPDGRHIVSGCDDNGAQLWDTESGTMVARFVGHSSAVDSVAASPDGRLVASASRDSTCRIWEARRDGKLLQTLQHPRAIHAVIFTSDRHVATGCLDGTARVWSIAVGKVVAELGGHTTAVVCSVCMPSAAGGTGCQQCAQQQRTADAEKVLLEQAQQQTDPEKLRFNQQQQQQQEKDADLYAGPLVATGSGDGNIIVHRSSKPPQMLRGHEVSAYISFCPTNADLLASVGTDNTLIVFDLNNNNNNNNNNNKLDSKIKTLHCPAELNSVSWSCDGRYVAAACWDFKCYVFDAHKNLQQLCILEGHVDVVCSVAFHPRDSVECVTASGDKTVRVWRLVGSKPLCLKMLYHNDFVRSCCWMPDGRHIVASGGRDAVLWDVEIGTVLARFVGHSDVVSSVAASPDGSMVASTSADQTCRIWEAMKNGKQLQLLNQPARVTAVTFCGNGLVVTGCTDGRTRVWSVADGKMVAELGGHGHGAVFSVAVPYVPPAMAEAAFSLQAFKAAARQQQQQQQNCPQCAQCQLQKDAEIAQLRRELQQKDAEIAQRDARIAELVENQ